ncbi:MAG: hypothetical protein JSR80_03600 [Verrucomicrobia bacterium]|nr:hypothetical protein [Verrucomicrobiota bacterium]
MSKILCFLLLFFPIWVAAQVCVAIEVGSDGVKYKIADRGEILASGEFPLLLHQAWEHSGTYVIPIEMEKKLINALEEILAQARSLKAKRYACVATEVLRQARNAKKVQARVKKETGLDLLIISQREEAILGLVATAAAVNIPEDQLVVWDLGGGSMEVSSFPQTYAFDFGAKGFRQEVVQKIKRENGKTVLSPNPMNREESEQAVALASSYAVTLPAPLQKKLGALPFYGIGALAFLDVPESRDKYTLSGLQAALREKLGKEDKELGGGLFVGEAVTNLCLAIGFMLPFRIETLYTSSVDLTDGLLLVVAYQRSLPG